MKGIAPHLGRLMRKAQWGIAPTGLRMKAAFGIVSLLVALAIVALLVKTQLTTVKAPAASSSPTAAYPDHGPAATESPQQIQQKVRADVNKAMQDAAAGRGEPTEK